VVVRWPSAGREGAAFEAVHPVELGPAEPAAAVHAAVAGPADPLDLAVLPVVAAELAAPRGRPRSAVDEVFDELNRGLTGSFISACISSRELYATMSLAHGSREGRKQPLGQSLPNPCTGRTCLPSHGRGC